LFVLSFKFLFACLLSCLCGCVVDVFHSLSKTDYPSDQRAHHSRTLRA
jgi:hypothetical protein